MLVTPTTIRKKEQKQETNAEADIPLESEHQESVLSINTCPVILHSPGHIITPSTHKTTNTRALYIQQSLVIQCLCIDKITVSLEEWA